MAQSRNEEILEATLNHQEYGKPPQSREEELLIELKEAIDQGGGGGTITIDPSPTQGSTNAVASGGTYTALSGKQNTIDSSHKLDADLVDDANSTHKFISTYGDLSDLPSINGVTLTGNKTSDDLDLTGLWIGTTAEYTQEAATIPAGTLVIKTDETGIDSTPTSGSSHPVSSGGVYTALTEKVDKVQGKGLSTEDFTAMYKAWLDVSRQSPLNHNGVFRGKDLTNVYTIDEMYDMNHAGTFDDLFLGDYFTKSITTDIMTRFTGETFESGVTYYEVGGADPVSRTFTSTEDTEPRSGKIYCTKLTKTENVDLMFAAFDYYYNTGDTALTTHHAILIPRNQGFETTAKMNPTNTTVGAYFNSDMHQITLPGYAKSIKTMLNNHLISHRSLLSNAINASTPSMAGAGMIGASSDWAWVTTELQLMNEVQVYGTTVWSSSAYEVGVDNKKLPVFNFINGILYGRNSFWLRSIVNSALFALCYNNGDVNTNGASNVYYVRPLILFG